MFFDGWAIGHAGAVGSTALGIYRHFPLSGSMIGEIPTGYRNLPDTFRLSSVII